MKVLSLFDGISCGMLALQRADIKVDRYVAFEIDKNSIKVSKSNFDNIEYEGSVIGADFKKYEGFDIVIGGSPCQGFSFAGKQLNFNDERSKLFFEFVRAIKEVKPKYFLLENVVMKKEYENVITKLLGVEPIEINSALVSAQNRRRLYWTNIPNVCQPEDKHIYLKDIIETQSDGINPAAIRGRYFGNTTIAKEGILHKGTIIGRRIGPDGHRKDYDKTVPVIQCLEVRKSNTQKSNCLTTVDKDNVLTPLGYGRHVDVFGKKLPYRNYTLKEYCRLQTLPDNYCDAVSEYVAKKAIGNGWTVDIIAWILSFLANYDDKK